ncbi:APC family permease [Amycolatopsis jejuensis]|uniref:APC family permease n=1 Tax=Amycolatopsis jejuensis TaxID=330084 RepID=UPI0006913D53|nr:APC family permease [Amycolatopsis jejuensis]
MTNPSLDQPSAVAGPATALPRKLGLFTLAALIVAWNAPIGAMAGFQQLAVAFGNGVGAPMALLVGGAVLFLFSIGFIGMSKYVANPGAYYTYIAQGLGKITGLSGAFVATAAYFLIGVGANIYLGLIFVDMTKRFFGAPVLNWQIWSLITLALVMVLGLLRVDLSMKVIGIMVILECVAVAVWQTAILVKGGPEGYAFESFTPHSFASGSIGLGVVFGMLTMIGFEGGACFRAETKNPERNVRRATYLAVAFMGLFYALGCWVYIIAFGPSHVVEAATADPVGSFFDSVQAFLGGFFVKLFTVILVTSQIASMISIQGNASRYLFSLGRDGVLSRKFAAVHPRLESPHVSVLTYAAFALVASLLIMTTGLDAVQSYAALTGAGIYFLLPLMAVTSIAVMIYFRRHPEQSPGRWVSIVAPVISGVALLVLFALMTGNLRILAGTSAGAVLALVAFAAVALAGILVAIRLKAKRPDAFDSIGTR